MKMKLLIHFALGCALMYLFSSCSLEKMGTSEPEKDIRKIF